MRRPRQIVALPGSFSLVRFGLARRTRPGKGLLALAGAGVFYGWAGLTAFGSPKTMTESPSR